MSATSEELDMESNLRILMKSLTWQTSGFVVMTLIGYLATGSFAIGGTIAVTSAAIGFVTYLIHEKLWSRVRWGRRVALPPENRI